MNRKKLSAVFFLCAIILFSCVENNTAIVPVPPDDYFIQEAEIIIDIDLITETKDGSSVENFPLWLSAFINGGIAEVENIDDYNDKYVFIGINEGKNLAALSMWVDNFSPVQDFAMLSAQRIQRRMLLGLSLYPDDEYGAFFETMVKRAYSAIYDNVIVEDNYWIKLKNDNETENEEIDSSHIYYYFVLILIDKISMHNIITKMAEESYLSVSSTASQRSSVNRLRQTFFEGF